MQGSKVSPPPGDGARPGPSARDDERARTGYSLSLPQTTRRTSRAPTHRRGSRAGRRRREPGVDDASHRSEQGQQDDRHRHACSVSEPPTSAAAHRDMKRRGSHRDRDSRRERFRPAPQRRNPPAAPAQRLAGIGDATAEARSARAEPLDGRRGEHQRCDDEPEDRAPLLWFLDVDAVRRIAGCRH